MSTRPVVTRDNYAATLAGLWALAALIEPMPCAKRTTSCAGNSSSSSGDRTLDHRDRSRWSSTRCPVP